MFYVYLYTEYFIDINDCRYLSCGEINPVCFLDSDIMLVLFGVESFLCSPQTQIP